MTAAEEFALRTHVAVALAESGTRFGYAKEPFRATLRATFEFCDADRRRSATAAADFVVSLVIKGLRRSER